MILKVLCAYKMKTEVNNTYAFQCKKSCGYKFCFMTRNMQITCKVATMHKFSKHDIKWTKVAKRYISRTK